MLHNYIEILFIKSLILNIAFSLSCNRLHMIAQKIVEIFPTETKVRYFIFT